MVGEKKPLIFYFFYGLMTILPDEFMKSPEAVEQETTQKASLDNSGIEVPLAEVLEGIVFNGGGPEWLSQMDGLLRASIGYRTEAIGEISLGLSGDLPDFSLRGDGEDPWGAVMARQRQIGELNEQIGREIGVLRALASLGNTEFWLARGDYERLFFDPAFTKEENEEINNLVLCLSPGLRRRVRLLRTTLYRGTREVGYDFFKRAWGLESYNATRNRIHKIIEVRGEDPDPVPTGARKRPTFKRYLGVAMEYLVFFEEEEPMRVVKSSGQKKKVGLRDDGEETLGEPANESVLSRKLEEAEEGKTGGVEPVEREEIGKVEGRSEVKIVALVEGEKVGEMREAGELEEERGLRLIERVKEIADGWREKGEDLRLKDFVQVWGCSEGVAKERILKIRQDLEIDLKDDSGEEGIILTSGQAVSVLGAGKLGWLEPDKRGEEGPEGPEKRGEEDLRLTGRVKEIVEGWKREGIEGVQVKHFMVAWGCKEAAARGRILRKCQDLGIDLKNDLGKNRFVLTLKEAVKVLAAGNPCWLERGRESQGERGGEEVVDEILPEPAEEELENLRARLTEKEKELLAGELGVLKEFWQFIQGKEGVSSGDFHRAFPKLKIGSASGAVRDVCEQMGIEMPTKVGVKGKRRRDLTFPAEERVGDIFKIWWSLRDKYGGETSEPVKKN